MASSSRGSESSSSSSNIRVDKYWEWIKELFEDEKMLPTLALPQTWEDIEKHHQQIAYNPETHGLMDTSEADPKKAYHKTKQDPVDFIHATAGRSSMPGTTQPASVRFELYNDPKFQESLVKDDDGNMLAPCLMHGDYVKVESLQADHLHAKEDIRKRQKQLVDKINSDPDFAECVMQLDGIDKFFKKTRMKQNESEKYYGTLFFYELYFNDIDNLWLICQACNLQKRDKKKEVQSEWFEKHWMYGKQFLDYIHQNRNNSAIIEKVQDGRGLGKVAIEWFWNHHAGYISRAQEFLKDVHIKVKILNKEIDHLVGSGKFEEASNLEMTFEYKVSVMKQVVKSDEISKEKVDEKVGHPVRKKDFKAAIEEGVSKSSSVFKDVSSEVAQVVKSIEAKRKAEGDADSQGEEVGKKDVEHKLPRRKK